MRMEKVKIITGILGKEIIVPAKRKAIIFSICPDEECNGIITDSELYSSIVPHKDGYIFIGYCLKCKGHVFYEE